MEYEKKHIFDNIIGQSDPMKEIFSIVEKVSNSNTTIIINGETGTGKGLLPGPFTKALIEETILLFRSIVVQLVKVFWKANFSVMLKGHLPVQ